MVNRKTWTVSLYKGADVDPDYKRLTNWAIKENGTPKIYAHTYDNNGDPNYTELKPVYKMKLSSIIVPNRDINFDINQIDFYDIYNCNYLVAQADYDPSHIYYGFIDLIDYVNDGVVKIQWKVDYWATYKDKINLAKAQYVNRAMYTPKAYMLDARRTVDPSLPTDKKQRLAYVKDITQNVGVKNSVDNGYDDDYKKENNFGNWYLFYLMPKSSLSEYFYDNNYPHMDSLLKYHNNVDTVKEVENGDNNPKIPAYKALGGYSGGIPGISLFDVEGDELDKTNGAFEAQWLDLDNVFSGLQASGYHSSTGEINGGGLLSFGTPEVYASTRMDAVLSLSLIAGEGVAILGCEVRNALDLSQFTAVDNSETIYKYTGGTSNSFYEVDNHMSDVDHTQEKFSNVYDKNRYREEITVAGKSLNVDPSLRMADTPGVHIWDSIMPGFKPIYSFYFVNGQLSPLSPAQAGDSDLVVTGDIDRSVPIYVNNALSYYLSHMTRINAEIQKQIISWKAQIKNSQLSYKNQLETIAKNYSVSLLDLENSLYNSKGLAQFNNKQDLSNLDSTYDNNKKNAKAQNDLDKDMLSNSQGAALTNLQDSNETSLTNLRNSNQVSLANLGSSQSVAEGNLGDSQSTAETNLGNSQSTAETNLGNSQSIAQTNLGNSQSNAQTNLGNSQSTAETNLGNSQSTAQTNLGNSQAASVANLKTANTASKDNQTASIKNSNVNATAQAGQNKTNLDTNLANQKTNIELQKAESFITGLNLTAGLAQFLTGAITSLLVGFLDIETAEKAATNNTNTQKKIIDANLKLQTDTISANNLNLALTNLKSNYDASVTQANNSNSTALSNLKSANTTALSNLKSANSTALKNLEAANTTALSNLKSSNTTALSNLKGANSTALGNLQSANSTASSNLLKANNQSYKNLGASQAQAETNLSKSQAQAETNLTTSQKAAVDNLKDSYQKVLNSLGLGVDNTKLNLANVLAKTLQSLDKNNELQKVNFNNAKVKAYILATMVQNVSQQQLANTIAASVDSYSTGIKAQVTDWNRGNWSKLTDGNGVAVQALHLLDAQDKIYEVQASTERQIKDKIYTTGALVNRRIPLKTLLMQPDLAGGGLIDYFLNSSDKVPQITNNEHGFIKSEGQIMFADHSTDNKLYIRQYVQTAGVQLEGNAPREALQTLQNALNSGIYLTIDHYGRYEMSIFDTEEATSETTTDGKPWNYYKPDANYALNTNHGVEINSIAENSMNDNQDWNNNLKDYNYGTNSDVTTIDNN